MQRLRDGTAAIALLALAGCADIQTRFLDPMLGKLDSPKVGYEGVMHIASVSLGTGDFANALSLYRHAAEMEPANPKPVMLAGVTLDVIGDHEAAQAEYAKGLALAPGDRSIILDMALSLALSGHSDRAVDELAPIALGAQATPQERQTLALIYGLHGDDKAARALGGRDLDALAVEHNVRFYETLRRLSPDARTRAILSASISRREELNE